MNKAQLIFSLILSWFFVLLCIVLHVFFIDGGIIAGDIKGFAIDTQENLYIGVHNRIIKFAEGDKDNDDILIPQMTDEYCFFIEDDSLIIGTKKGQSVKKYDLQGNYIEKSPLTYDEAKTQSSYKTLVSENGNTFKLLDYHGFKPAEVQRNGKTVYHMSIIDFLFSDTIFFVLLIVFGLVALYFFIRLYQNPEIQHFLGK